MKYSPNKGTLLFCFEKIRDLLYEKEDLSFLEIKETWEQCNYSNELVFYTLNHLDTFNFEIKDFLVEMLLSNYILNHVFKDLFSKGFWGNTRERVDTFYLKKGRQAKNFKEIFSQAPEEDFFLLIVSLRLSYNWKDPSLNVTAFTSEPGVSLTESLDLSRSRDLVSAFASAKQWSEDTTQKLSEILGT